MFGILSFLGGLFAAAQPALAVYSTGEAMRKGIKYADEQISKRLPDMPDDTDYFPHRFVFQEGDAETLGLSRREWRVLWSAEELGQYALYEGWILSGTAATNKNKRALRLLLSKGHRRYLQMTGR